MKMYPTTEDQTHIPNDCILPPPSVTTDSYLNYSFVVPYKSTELTKKQIKSRYKAKKAKHSRKINRK